MKRIFLILLFGILTSSTYAQKGKVKAAANYLKDTYKQYDKAREAIDEAVANEETRNSAEAWYYRGRIYSALYKDEKYGSLCDNCLQVAYESFQRSLELDPKGEKALEITALHYPPLAQKFMNEGVGFYQKEEYAKAQAAFETIMNILPGDTTALKNSAFAAQYAGDTAKARQYYETLLDKGVKAPYIYSSLASLYRDQKNNAKALEVIQQGRATYPDTLGLAYDEINVLLSMNKTQEASAVIEKVIARDPGNESLYLVLGNNYEQLANPRDDSGKELPKPGNSADMMKMAADVYAKGLAVNPNNYGLNFNLGAYYFNLAAEQINASNASKSDAESDKLKKEAEQNFRAAQPYLEKAMATNPRQNEEDNKTYTDTLVSLKELYARTSQTELYKKVDEILNK